MNFYVGTSGYGYKEWRGIFYPERISAGEMLRFYSGRLNAVEINNTFYRMPTQRLLLSWEKQVPASFVFALKAPQVITHLKRLKGVEEETGYMFNALNALESKLGPVLFQFPKSFRADRPTLQAFLNLIPAGVSCAFEFRSTSWLDAEVLDVLHKKGCSFCTADTDENPAREIISTASWGYLRLRRSHYSDTDLSQWIERVLSQKWKKVFVFFKHEEEAKGAELAMRFKELASA
jgi:uncharacterized protein YecE (DUF72 family)